MDKTQSLHSSNRPICSTSDPRAGIGIGEDGDPMFTLQSGKQHAIAIGLGSDPIAFDTTQMTSAANYSNPKPGDPCHPLASGSHPPAIAFSCKDSGLDSGEQSPTLRSMGHDGSHANAGGQVAVAINLRGRDGGAMPECDEVASLRSASGGSSRSYVQQEAVAISGRARGDDGRGYVCGEHVSELAGTLDAVKPDRVFSGMAVRRLTPVECERLQGFPDGYTNIPGYNSRHTGEFGGNRGVADGPRYRALGNSMAVPVMLWIGKRIAEVIG